VSRADLGGNLAAEAFSKAAVTLARRRAVSQAWRLEAKMVRMTGRGTVDWTEGEIDELLNTGKVKGYQGHHINSVNEHPQLAGEPSNIKFTKNNLGEHNGNFRNPTSGPLIPRP
jgi:hypothetical protein